MYAATIARKTQSILGQKAFLLSLRNQYRSDALQARQPSTGNTGDARPAHRARQPPFGDRSDRPALARPDGSESQYRVHHGRYRLVQALERYRRPRRRRRPASGGSLIRSRNRSAGRRRRVPLWRRGIPRRSRRTPRPIWPGPSRNASAARWKRSASSIPECDPADDSTGVVTISLGVAFAQEGAAPEMVAKWADDALYDAKRGGRNIVFLSNAHAAARCAIAACRQPEAARAESERIRATNHQRRKGSSQRIAHPTAATYAAAAVTTCASSASRFDCVR